MECEEETILVWCQVGVVSLRVIRKGNDFRLPGSLPVFCLLIMYVVDSLSLFAAVSTTHW